ncbi:MAG: SET domain-containing protein-lysine N-methyltransferase [Anaerolineaceae bacterium]|nr:SET domain-containing protein-lysine N-methyltransferase [Anaerolineaceae bacterium]
MSTSEESSCYFSSRLEVRHAGDKGVGMFAREPIYAGELLLAMGGKILTHERLADTGHTFSIQIEENAYICPIQEENAYRINHSCNPNVGVVGQITFVALQDIAPGEEICYDYAMTDGGPYDEFECRCGSVNCRHHVTGNDWKLPELWARYGEHFSPYLLRRIQRLQSIRLAEAV